MEYWQSEKEQLINEMIAIWGKNCLRVQDVTFQDDMREENFLSDIWQHVINGKIPSLFSLCSVKIFQLCCTGDSCSINCPDHGLCTHCCRCIAQERWHRFPPNRSPSSGSYNKKGNYYEIIWFLIKQALKEVKVSSRVPLSTSISEIGNIHQLFRVLKYSSEPCFSRAFYFNNMCRDEVSKPHQVQRLNLPKRIERYLTIPSRQISLQYERFPSISDSKRE